MLGSKDFDLGIEELLSVSFLEITFTGISSGSDLLDNSIKITI